LRRAKRRQRNGGEVVVVESREGEGGGGAKVKSSAGEEERSVGLRVRVRGARVCGGGYWVRGGVVGGGVRKND
jgi:hypothetical protein